MILAEKHPIIRWMHNAGSNFWQKRFSHLFMFFEYENNRSPSIEILHAM